MTPSIFEAYCAFETRPADRPQVHYTEQSGAIQAADFQALPPAFLSNHSKKE
jgi:hypothetical protein